MLNKSGFYVHLKPLNSDISGEVGGDGLNYNCNLSVTMMYLNYTRAGVNPDIPCYGFYVLWAPDDYVLPDSDFLQRVSIFENELISEERRSSKQWNLQPGTALIVPWMKTPPSDSPPYLLRILAEGEITPVFV